MPKVNEQILGFNRGVISPLALARFDIERTKWSAETQTNWMPRLLGSMMLRPGLEYTATTHSNNTAVHIPFVYSKSDTAIIEISDSIIRIKVSETPITRASVSSAVTNGTFDANIASWTDNDEVGGVASWATGGYAQLLGDGTNESRLTQSVTVAGGDQSVEHALRVIINRGPVTFKVGSTSGDDDYVTEAILGTGTHSLAFTPTGNFFIDFSSRENRIVLIDSVAVEASGIMTLPSPYAEADLPLIRSDQSSDIVYLACKTFQQRKIERRATKSWSIVLYEPEDGPVRVQNLSKITIAASAITGNVTLTASKALFDANHVGALFKLISNGQTVTASLSAQNTFTDTIEVTGSGTSREFTITITGLTGTSSTVNLQRSFDEGVSWSDVTSYTVNFGPTTYDDGLTNQIPLYRIGVKTGDYSSGTIVCTLTYALGSITGYTRILTYSSDTSVTAEILKALGNTTATLNWAEGEWSSFRGYPSAVALAEGRLGWSGKGKTIYSISDAYESFDDSIEGDSGLVSRTLGSGSIDNVNWMVGVYRIFIGTDTAEKSIKTTSLEEPITPTNFKIVDTSTQGSKNINPAKLDKKIIFVQAGGTRVFELTYDASSLDYTSNELSKLSPEIGNPSIIRIAVQRQPDTRIHCVRSDGKVAIILFDPIENLIGPVLFETDGVVEDVVILPGDVEDAVYYSVKRTINSVTKRYLEKFALESECQGGTQNKQADSFITYSGVSATSITGLSHLEGEEVVVWGDGIDYSPEVSGTQTTYTVASGAITLATAISSGVIGLPYTADYKSVKLAYGAGLGTGFNQVKRINNLGAILYNTHYQGLKYGSDTSNLDNLSLVKDGKVTTVNTIHSSFDDDMFPFDGDWGTDSRVCLQANAPRPCTVLGVTFGIVTNDKG